MKIAILAPSSVPFTMGGAEYLWLGLQRFINEATTHHCELFKVPVRENNLEQLVESYTKFCQIDVRDFDLVITTKYPAWMIEHDNHRIYMQHTLRGLYDTYHLTKQPLDYRRPNGNVDLFTKMDRLSSSKYTSNEEVLAFLDYLSHAVRAGDIGSQLTRFPGPFCRDVVHRLDAVAMRPSRVAKYTAISNTVRSRQDYFPQSVHVDVVHHPSYLEGFYCGNDEFLFTASRLDGPKRIDLLIDTMKYVKSGIQLLIGGTGPEEGRLKMKADEDSRIKFLGRLSSVDLLDYYANALAVPFVPYDEDYGLITIEAMKSGKPVITAKDSGGVTEFVIQNETGICTAPDPQALASAIDYLCEHRSEAKEMGRKATQAVANITWEHVAAKLIDEDIFHRKPGKSRDNVPKKRKKMVVAVTFPIYPPRGGGQSRIYHLYREWAKHYDITLLTLGGVNDSLDRYIAPGLREIRIPKSAEHQQAENQLSREVGWVPITDIVASRFLDKTPEFISVTRAICRNAEMVVASHPYLAQVLIASAPEAQLWFEVHNVEQTLKEQLLPRTRTSRELINVVKENESTAWHAADIVYACSKNDLKQLERLYGSTQGLKLEVPNGYSPDEISFVPKHRKNVVRKKLGLEGLPVTLFMGSWHGPNIEAVEHIIRFATKLPEVIFLVIGSCSSKFKDVAVPENVRFLGVLDEREKQVALAAADLAVNPMGTGSGSNLKMLDFFAVGAPVLSTPFGARGIEVRPGKHFIAANLSEFSEKIYEFFVETDDDTKTTLSVSAHHVVREKYSWPAIARQGLARIEEALKEKAASLND